jgi:hypothetical protein
MSVHFTTYNRLPSAQSPTDSSRQYPLSPSPTFVSGLCSLLSPSFQPFSIRYARTSTQIYPPNPPMYHLCFPFFFYPGWVGSDGACSGQ